VNAPAPVLFPQVSVGDVLPELAIEVTPTTVVLGALASRDWRPMHHDYKFATERNGVRDIFLNTPNQAAWFERYLTDWGGPRARLGRMTFRMRSSVFPGDEMVFAATVTGVSRDGSGCGWVDLDLRLSVREADGDPRVATTCAARVALPETLDDNPWSRSGDRWLP
jgi:acyl dehydratase